MCGREKDFSSQPGSQLPSRDLPESSPANSIAEGGLPEPSGARDDRFVYQLTAAGREALALHALGEREGYGPGTGNGNGGGGNGAGVPVTPALAAALDEAARKEAKRQRARQARARGNRYATICGRWRGEHRVADLRLSGRWLEEAGFELGREFEVVVEEGRLVILGVK